MVASDKFNVGDEVKLTRAGMKALESNERVRGRVAAFCSFPCHLMIQRDGVARAERCHMDFWEPVVPSTTGARR
jgi:hypothetical protein